MITAIALTVLLLAAFAVVFALGMKRGRRRGVTDAALRLLASSDATCQEAARYLHCDLLEEEDRVAERAKRMAQAEKTIALQAKVIEVATQRLDARVPRSQRPETQSVDEFAKAETHRFERPKR